MKEKRSMKKKLLKKCGAALLTMCMVFAMIPTFTYAADAANLNIGEGSIYLQENGGSLQYSRDEADWTDYEGICTITGDGTTTSNKIIVKSGSHTIKLSGVNIDVSANTNSCAFDIQSSAGDVTVELEGTNTLTSGGFRAGIEKNSADDKSLTITSAAGDGKTDGSLTATSGGFGAGIGGGNGGGNGRNIVINGGTITATSTYGAGIGGGNGISGGGSGGSNGGNGGNGENITISGGTIIATSRDGAGIGGGNGGKGGEGGNGGRGGDGRNIIINGGTVTATSTDGAGIGGGNGGTGENGESAGGNGGDGGKGENIIIKGGTVTATGGIAGIGGGSGGAGGRGMDLSGSVGSAGSQTDNKIVATADCKANAWAGEDENNTTQFLTDETSEYTIADGDIAKYMKIVMGDVTSGGSSSSGGSSTYIPDNKIATADMEIDKTEARGNIFGSASTVDVTGKNRVETSLQLADQVKKALGVEKFSTVIIASGTDYPDGLGVSALSIQQKAPVLIVTPSTEATVKKYIEDNLVEGGKVIITGGTGAVSQNMQSLLNGIDVTRLGGADRYATNLQTIKELLAKGAGKDEILIASGKDFADALSASATGKIIMIVGDNLTNEQKTLLKDTGFGKVTILGGTGAVSQAVENQLNSTTGKTAERVGGKNRIETSRLIAARYFPASTTSVYTKADGFADGLAGGLLANITGSPMRLAYGAKDMTAGGRSITLGGVK